MSNPFNMCNSDAEIMKMVFELSATGKYSRQQLNVMAATRREELKDKSKVQDITAIKVIVPTDSVFQQLGLDRSKVFITKDFRTSSVFEFLGNGMIRF